MLNNSRKANDNDVPDVEIVVNHHDVDVTDYYSYSFTPSQSLVLEVLAARYRLGEKSWTFEARDNKALAGLEKVGLLSWKSAVIEGYSLVWLTDLGKAVLLAAPYNSYEGNPVVHAARKELKAIQKEAKRLKKQFQQKGKA